MNLTAFTDLFQGSSRTFVQSLIHSHETEQSSVFHCMLCQLLSHKVTLNVIRGLNHLRLPILALIPIRGNINVLKINTFLFHRFQILFNRKTGTILRLIQLTQIQCLKFHRARRIVPQAIYISQAHVTETLAVLEILCINNVLFHYGDKEGIKWLAFRWLSNVLIRTEKHFQPWEILLHPVRMLTHNPCIIHRGNKMCNCWHTLAGVLTLSCSCSSSHTSGVTPWAWGLLVEGKLKRPHTQIGYHSQSSRSCLIIVIFWQKWTVRKQAKNKSILIRIERRWI